VLLGLRSRGGIPTCWPGEEIPGAGKAAARFLPWPLQDLALVLVAEERGLRERQAWCPLAWYGQEGARLGEAAGRLEGALHPGPLLCAGSAPVGRERAGLGREHCGHPSAVLPRCPGLFVTEAA